MERSRCEGRDGLESLPPPPPLTSETVPKLAQPKRVPMARSSTGTKGQRLQLQTNHFKVGMSKFDGCFYHYSITMKYEDGNVAEGKIVGRKVVKKLYETYGGELKNKNFAYDGEKSLFTVGSLPAKKLEFMVVLEELPSYRVGDHNGSPSESGKKRTKSSHKSKTMKVEISFAAAIPFKAIKDALNGKDSEHFQEAVRVLDIVLRQHASNQGCLLVRQSFFHNNPRNFTELGGGVLGCRGFHSSFRATQGGLSLNIDVSTTMIVQPGPVMDFLIMNQNVRHPSQIDWNKAKRMLKNLRITVSNSNMEHKITGMSDKPCNQQKFVMKQRNGNGDGEELTIYEYFVHNKSIQLKYSADLPCINVGKPKHPSYFPIELCSLVSLQRYTKALSSQQRASLVEKSRQKPQERKAVLVDALRNSNYAADPMLRSSGISITNEFPQIEGRVLPAPRLIVGKGENFFPRNGRWNYNNKHLETPVQIKYWAVVNFSGRPNIDELLRILSRCAQSKGIEIAPPAEKFDESPQFKRLPPLKRVESMFEYMPKRLKERPQFLLCILPERKNSDLYGPWKRKCLTESGVVTQCVAPPPKLNDQFMTNLLLKINAKLGGINSKITPSIPLINDRPTLILGMDVSHGSPGRADVPSIAAVVSSRHWPSISKYRAEVRTQSPKVEMVASLFMPAEKADNGIIRELLVDFYSTSGQRKPDQIIIFRDGVSESQFNQVLNLELNQIIEACRFLEQQSTWDPKFTVIIAQKNHHTKFFQAGSPDNVPPGTVIDTKVCHPKNNDFYLCAHAGMIGTTRPTHYHVLYDEINFSADQLQELVHNLSYVYQRSTTAVSIVAPICYAHLAASQVSQFIKFDEMSETSSSQGGVTVPGSVPVPQLPKLHKNVKHSMFFC